MTQHSKNILTAVVIVFVIGMIFYLESRKTERPDLFSGNGESDIEIQISKVVSDGTTDGDTTAMSNEERASRIKKKISQYERVKEITTPDGFVNTDGITITDLVGKKVILVDFWTYSCINCQRTLPYLNSWYEKYADKGLTILGIHTPEFEFEKEYENVKRATEKFDVKYPVILDNDYSTWTDYKNRYWPRKYLIDIDGFIVYDHIGEGAYEETEAKIVDLLNERSETLGESAISMIDMLVYADEVDFSRVRTPEIYLGYGRSEYLANLPSRVCFNHPCDYVKPKEVKMNTYVLSGRWNMEEEAATLVAGGGDIVIRFSANKVNIVGGSSAGVQAEIMLDGMRVNSSFAGSDVSSDGSVTFKEHGLYNLIDLKGEYGEHELIIRFFEPGINAFAFTFG